MVFTILVLIKENELVKELRLTGVIRVLEKGGSTKPLLVEAEDEKGRVSQYVVKLYSHDFSVNHYVVGKEILINELAREFNLTTPEYAVIDLDHEILREHYSPQMFGRFHIGYKFCSEFMEGWVLYADLKSSILNQYDIENVFAFDNMIVNVDRGGRRNKPNLLVNDEELLLIDHEQGLTFFNSLMPDNIDYKQVFNSYQFHLHIFYRNLKSRRKNKAHLFDEFVENLRFLDFSFLDDLYEAFDKYGINCGEKNTIFAYLNWCKVNSHYIQKKLLERVA